MISEITPEGVCTVWLLDLKSVGFQQRTVISANIPVGKKCPKMEVPPDKTRFLACATLAPHVNAGRSMKFGFYTLFAVI